MAEDDRGGVYGNGAGRLLYPPRRTVPAEAVIEPPVTSIRFEALRDGIEDREYFVLLKRHLERGQSAGPACQKALDWVHNDVTKTMTCYEQTPAVYLAARHAVACAIESCRGNE